MKINLHIKKALTLVSLIGLITLLLLAPCKVRKSVQTALEMPPTEVSNKSVCQAYQDVESAVSATKTVQQTAPAILGTNPQLLIVADLSQHPVTQFTDKSESVARIPYYILYQNLKVHL